MPEVLTPDDSVEKPSGRELDAAVAERIMGFVQHESGVLLPNDNRLSLWFDDAMQREANEGNLWLRVPQYCSSIEAAMEVVEKMDQEQWCIWIISQVHKGPKWGVSFEAKDRHEGFAADDSLPKAISLAALKAVGAE